MGFFKTGNVYRIIRITGAQDNILGIVFSERDMEEDIEVIEWNFHDLDKSRIQASKEEVLDQVISGLESINQSLGTNYKLSKVYFSPFDPARSRVFPIRRGVNLSTILVFPFLRCNSYCL